MPRSQQVGEPLLCFLGEMLVELPEMAASGRENQLLQVDPFRGCGGKCPRPPSSLKHRDPCFCWRGGLKVGTGVWGDQGRAGLVPPGGTHRPVNARPRGEDVSSGRGDRSLVPKRAGVHGCPLGQT